MKVIVSTKKIREKSIGNEILQIHHFFQTSDGQQQYIVLEITQLNEGEEAVQQESKVQQVLQSSSSTSGKKLNFWNKM